MEWQEGETEGNLSKYLTWIIYEKEKNWFNLLREDFEIVSLSRMFHFEQIGKWIWNKSENEFRANFSFLTFTSVSLKLKNIFESSFRKSCKKFSLIILHITSRCSKKICFERSERKSFSFNFYYHLRIELSFSQKKKSKGMNVSREEIEAQLRKLFELELKLSCKFSRMLKLYFSIRGVDAKKRTNKRKIGEESF